MKTSILLFLFLCAVVEGEIYEMGHFDELKNHLVPGSIVVVDIDDTLMVPVQMLGVTSGLKNPALKGMGFSYRQGRGIHR